MDKEELNRLIEVGREMRTFQKRYFKFRLANDLSICKHLEKQFDELLKQCSQSRKQQFQLLP